MSQACWSVWASHTWFVGGFAAIIYGEPRLTIDVDIVVEMDPRHVEPLVAAFPIPDYYASDEGIHDSLQRGYRFSVIQPSTGAKVDLVPLPDDPFTQAAFQRRIQMEYDEAGSTASFISAEDIVLAKLIALRNTGSDKHLRDARGVLVMQWGDLDLGAMRGGARACGILSTLDELLAEVERELEG